MKYMKLDKLFKSFILPASLAFNPIKRICYSALRNLLPCCSVKVIWVKRYPVSVAVK